MAFSKIGKFFGISDEENEMLDNEEYLESQDELENSIPSGSIDNDKIVSIKSGSSSAKSNIVLYEPRVYSDAKDVAQNLLNNKAVIINFSRMEDASSRRIVDFITGTVYALNGEIQRIGDKIFLATPPKFVTDGKISDLVDKKDNLS
ncbi:Cell division protein SepF [Lactobacillus apis]|uniref:Cell division protein SepF n=2 Tax=Lactobacillus apis TaxID=303541 RepID=A0A0F4LUU1_9LACO|nr:Cell division protein SepF [Lactobacillus apis]